MSAQERRFVFGPARIIDGAMAVSADTIYSTECGYGFEPGATLRVVGEGGRQSLTSDTPFYFSVALPEGNYRVTVSLGDTSGKNAATIKAELRRLMLENIFSDSDGASTSAFVVNLRRPQIAGAADAEGKPLEVRLKPRERAEEAWAWDEKLTLEFNGQHPSVRAIEITRADDLPTVFLLGDSTVADQPREPYASWEQMFTRFFGPTVAIANHSESGESLASAMSERRLDKVLSLARPGDWVFVQFGHNDMKKDDVPTYTANLKKFTAALAAKKASVVLVTQMHRHTFGPAGKLTNSHKDYPDAVRAVAREESLPLIDLHAMSQVLYETLGAEKALLAFKPGDITHHNTYGAYQLAKCVIEGVRQHVPELAKHVVADLPRFDPSKPDPVETFSLPLSPTVAAAKPDGS
jgi:lysophospholipase L1-like esterase